MKKAFSAILIMAFLFSFASCGPTRVSVRPEAPIVVRPNSPGSDYVWIEGEWYRAGGRYQYRNGYWARPRSHRVYQTGEWQQRGNGWRWNRGRWHR